MTSILTMSHVYLTTVACYDKYFNDVTGVLDDLFAMTGILTMSHVYLTTVACYDRYFNDVTGVLDDRCLL